MDLRLVFILAVLGIVRCELINSCKETRKFVDGHNFRRLQLANGEVSDQPAASEMTYVVWDEELATKARDWAARNKYGHNPNRTVPSGRFTTGENIYFYGATGKNPEFDADLAMQGWWSEHEDYKYKPLSMSDFKSPPQIGHYTQMAWASTTRIGCGISRYRDGEWVNFLVVCNYGPTGNFLGETPYDSDEGASGRLECGESDCSQLYGDQCQ